MDAPIRTEAPARARSPWTWIPTLYLAEGLPYVVVMSVSGLMYKDFKISNTEITLYTSWLYLPWVIKPLWSPVVEILGTRRLWIWVTQVLMGAGFAGVAMALPVPNFLQWSLVFFWLMAFNSATHDIAADGFYLLGTREDQQAYFLGVRTTFYRLATIAGQGLLVMLAGHIQDLGGSVASAWSTAMGTLAVLFVIFGLWHRFILPRPASDRPGVARDIPQFVREFLTTFDSFFRRPHIVVLMSFLLLYRFGEAQLVKMAPLFLRDPRVKGGLGLTTTEVGLVYGTNGILALTLGGILGGIVISRRGLKAWLWIMLLAIHLPDAVFIYLAYAQPTNLVITQLCIAVEQFGYGFGLTAYLMYMIHIARGSHKTSHYAICTGFMALGMMIPGMWSGWLADHIGYRHFFTWVIIATLPSFVVALRVPLEVDFGRKAQA